MKPTGVLINASPEPFTNWAASIGEDVRRFFGEIIENGEKTGAYRVYFASAREAVNMALAAVDGHAGSPGEFRDYRLKTIMEEKN